MLISFLSFTHIISSTNNSSEFAVMPEASKINAHKNYFKFLGERTLIIIPKSKSDVDLGLQ
jgi:hypothetical protein